VTLCA